jgi:hypothetical protein
MEKESLPLSPAMGVALAVTAFITVAIGMFPNAMIETVNWVWGLTETAPMAHLIR